MSHFKLQRKKKKKTRAIIAFVSVDGSAFVTVMNNNDSRSTAHSSQNKSSYLCIIIKI